MGDDELTVVAWNVRQGGGRRSQGIADALIALGADVAVISEHRPSGDLAARLKDAGYAEQVGGDDPSGGHTGLLIAGRREFAKLPEADRVRYGSSRDRHRVQHARVGGYDLLGCYIPGLSGGADRKRAFWQFLVDIGAPALADQQALILGDLNTGLHYRDELGATLYCADLHAQLEEDGWRDAWVEMHPTERPPGSWYSQRVHNPFRLDHVLMSPKVGRPLRVDYPSVLPDGAPLRGKGGLSDHLPVLISLPTAG